MRLGHFAKTLILACFLGLPLVSLAENKESQVKLKTQSPPRLYLGFSTGVNNSLGFIGPQVDVAITEQWSVGTGIGLSTWGNKMFLEGRYYFGERNRGWAISGGVTYSAGSRGLLIPGVETVYGTDDVVIDQNSQYNAMVAAGYFFKLGKSGRNRFHVQAGYSLPLGTNGSFETEAPLSPDGEKQIRFLAPSGLMVGLGFSFGFSAL